jgi:hypothetical protein
MARGSYIVPNARAISLQAQDALAVPPEIAELIMAPTFQIQRQ